MERVFLPGDGGVIASVVFWKGGWEDFLYCKSKISILCNDDGWTWISVFSFFVL